MSTLPEDLKSKALETPNIPAAVVCPNQESILTAVIEAKNMNLIDPTLIGNKSLIAETAKKLSLDISNFNIVEAKDEEDSASIACQMSNENKSKIIIKGNLHTDILMRSYLKKEFNLLDGRRLSHIWHMTTPQLTKPLFITDGALNVLPRVDIKLQILKNAVQFCNKLNISKPKVAILSGTEDPIESMPSSIEAKEVMDRAINENINAYVQGPLAFDNAISPEAAAIKNISNEVAGQADILLVPNLETGNSLSKIMVYFMGACAAGFIVGGKVPVVVTSRADNSASRIASIAASVIASQ